MYNPEKIRLSNFHRSTTSRIEEKTQSLQEEALASHKLGISTKEAIDRIEEGQLKNTEASKNLVAYTSNTETMVREILRAINTFTSTASQILQQALTTNLEIYSILRQLQTTISRGPTVPIEDCFRFTDAFGRNIDLPHQWFKHWEIFEARIRVSLKDMPGEQRARCGQYHVLNKRGANDIIGKHRWENTVFPGSEVYISIPVLESIGLAPIAS
jgi:hypothetical protein